MELNNEYAPTEAKRGKKWPYVIGLTVILSALTAGYYFFAVRGSRNDILVGSETKRVEAANEIRSLTAAIGKFFVLPDEEPTLATVTDVEKLRSQPFFAKAKKGDKVLIYSKAAKAILYDPVSNKVIEVAPLKLDTNAPSSQ